MHYVYSMIIICSLYTFRREESIDILVSIVVLFDNTITILSINMIESDEERGGGEKIK